MTLPMMPPTEPKKASYENDKAEVHRNIKELFRRLDKGRGSLFAKVHVGSAEPPEYEVGTLWYDTDAPTE